MLMTRICRKAKYGFSSFLGRDRYPLLFARNPSSVCYACAANRLPVTVKEDVHTVSVVGVVRKRCDRPSWANAIAGRTLYLRESGFAERGGGKNAVTNLNIRYELETSGFELNGFSAREARSGYSVLT